LTPQKPAYGQCSKAVQKWLDEEYPWKNASSALVARYTGALRRAYATSASILDTPKGQTPIIKAEAKRLAFNMMSAITHQGMVRFMTDHETITVNVLLKSFKRLIKDAQRKVFLILDNLSVHHAHLVGDWLDQHREAIEVY
jgi:hypothetical protein